MILLYALIILNFNSRVYIHKRRKLKKSIKFNWKTPRSLQQLSKTIRDIISSDPLSALNLLLINTT